MKPSPPPVSLGHATYPPGLIETAARLNRNYVSWDGLKERELGDDSALDIWRVMAAIRSATAEIVNVGGSVFSWNVTASMAADMHFIDLRNTPGDMFGDLGRRESKALLDESIAEEAIASCLIAGCMISRDKTVRRIREGKVPIGRYETAVHDTMRMIRAAVESASEPLTPELLERVAGTGIRGDDAVVPEPHSHEPDIEPYRASAISQAISDLAAFAEDEAVHPVVRAFSIEYMIVRISPFRTGNGRVARAMAVWSLERSGYGSAKFIPVSRYRNRWRGHYVKAFETSQAEHDDLTYAVSFCLTSLVKTAMRFDADRESGDGRPVCLPQGTEPLTARRGAELSWMAGLGRPVTLREMSSKFAISYQTARTDTISLMDSGFVVKDGREGHRDVFSVSERFLSTRDR